MGVNTVFINTVFLLFLVLYDLLGCVLCSRKYNIWLEFLAIFFVFIDITVPRSPVCFFPCTVPQVIASHPHPAEDPQCQRDGFAYLLLTIPVNTCRECDMCVSKYMVKSKHGLGGGPAVLHTLYHRCMPLLCLSTGGSCLLRLRLTCHSPGLFDMTEHLSSFLCRAQHSCA